MKATMRRLVRADPDDRWAAAFGRIAVYSFLVALVSGILLLPFFRPSMTPVVYHGSYSKLDGLTMSRAYQSTLNISFDVRGGLLIRQVHHWSADLFVAAVCLRLMRVFFRGRFRRPDWLIWVGLLHPQAPGSERTASTSVPPPPRLPRPPCPTLSSCSTV
jgi:ubiquinol-cytochrome c reductase cytochrome b subunit